MAAYCRRQFAVLLALCILAVTVTAASTHQVQLPAVAALSQLQSRRTPISPRFRSKRASDIVLALRRRASLMLEMLAVLA